VTLRRRSLIGVACVPLLPAAAQAQGTGALRFIVPASPGGFSDLMGRLVAEAMGPELGQAIVVDNRPGASGLIGTRAVAAAAPDGGTVLVTSQSNHVLAPLVQPGAHFDTQAELQPVGLIARAVGVLAVSNATPARTLGELVALARRKPGSLNYGSSGIGSGNHLAMESFKSLAGIDLVHVPYKGGAPLLQALMANEAQAGLLDYGSARVALEAGSVRALAQTGERRHAALPQVPTLREAGYANFDPSFWIGLAVPKATPPAAVQRLNAALNRALAQTALKARAQANGWVLVGGTPQAMATVVQRDGELLGAEVRRLKLAP
jgi:tripartite-type tricarboxylate transporter receptor subunit TctC